MPASVSNGETALSTKTAPASRERAAMLADLRRVVRAFGECPWPDRGTFARARKRARERAVAVHEGSGPGAEAIRTSLLVGAVELLRAASLELPSQNLPELAEQVQDITGLTRLALAREVVRSPELLAVPPDVAVEAILATLIAFAPLRSVSLWTPGVSEQVSCVSHLGAGQPSRGARQLAQRMLTGEEVEPTGPAGARRLLLGLAVGGRRHPLAVLVGFAKPWMPDRCRAFLEEATPALRAVLERNTLLAGNAASERALLEASERKLVRLGFDLHDGPIQDVAVLAEDLRLFRTQLEQLVGSPPGNQLVRGRIEDLDAQISGLGNELRRMTSEVHTASVLLDRPFRSALREQVRAFEARTGIEPRLKLEGEMSLLSTSQQIALLNIVREALNNVREHAGASAVEVGVSVTKDGVQAQIVDDGQGFDREATLMRAAREGRMGLLAMNERIRLLGGECRIESRPGGPTSVSIALKRWLPLTAAAESTRESA